MVMYLVLIRVEVFLTKCIDSGLTCLDIHKVLRYLMRIVLIFDVTVNNNESSFMKNKKGF